MDKLKNSFFEAYFDMPVPRVVVRTNTPDYIIIEANYTYLSATGLTKDQVVNQPLFNLFCVPATEKKEKEMLQKALQDVVKVKAQVNTPVFEIPHELPDSNYTSWWQIELLPVWEENSEKPTYLIVTGKDVTAETIIQKELENSRHREQMLHEELAATNEELSAANEELNTTVESLRQSQESLLELNNELENRVKQRTAELFNTQSELSEQHKLLATIVNEVPAGICVLKGPEMRLETINRQLLEFWKKDENILGMPLVNILPEIKNQEFPELLAEVYQTGVPHSSFDAHVELIIDGIKKTVYRDYSYTPIKDDDGKTHSIVAMAADVTERTISRLREQQLLEEQSAINEELSASNEELAATNEELSEAREQQQQLINFLAKSESRFRKLIMDAPVAICVLKGHDYILDAVNSEGLNILGKNKDIIGKPLRKSLPDAENRPFIDLLNTTYRSAELYQGNEVPATFIQNGVPVKDYFNFVFKPVKNENNLVDGIIIVASKVTSLVKVRQEKESAETKLGFAIDAAQMGSWHIDPKTKELHYNASLAKLFGYEDSEPMTYDQAIAQVTDDCREYLLTEIENAITHGDVYDVTYTQRRFNDNQIIWLRSLGKINQDQLGNYSLFSGIVMDVTEQKKDEQRKNDFIGMVSHELKTPLTSLSGYTQILHNKAVKNEDAFAISALAKVNDQVKKMTSLINGFLNISRLESGKIHLKKQTFDLDELVKEQIDDSKLLSNSHKIHFWPCENVPVFADRDKIGSVLSNLISNAVKYSLPGKPIQIFCEIKDSLACISVKDEGMGINPDDLPKLFDRFYRVANEQTQLISGFGIGLYLCAEIIQHHEGRIWAESEPGKGSAFHFSLPLAIV